MSKTTIIIAILVLLLGIAGYFGYQEYRRSQLLNSGDEILLVSKGLGLYTTTALIPADEITRDYRAVDKVNNLSEDEYARMIEGLSLYGTQLVMTPPESTLNLPEGEALNRWVQLYQTLPSTVDQLCKQIDQTNFAHECAVRHLIVSFVEQNAPAENCAALFPEELVIECQQTLERGDVGTLTDNDGDGLIDMYEFYADPLSFEADPLS